jgi:hypothetical protein
LFITQNCCSGCYFGLRYVGVLMYADDLVLLCPSLRGLRKMLACANAFACSRNLLFNPEKSFAVAFGNPQISQFALAVNAVDIRWVDRITHLGISVHHMLDDSKHIQCLIADFYARINSIMCCFRFNRDALLFLFRTCCQSYYAVECCRISCAKFKLLFTAWNKAARRLYRLPYHTHTRFLPTITGIDHASIAIKIRMLRFALRCRESPNDLVASVAKYSCSTRFAILGHNLRVVLNDCNLSSRFACLRNRDVTVAAMYMRKGFFSETELWKVKFILDLLDMNAVSNTDSVILNSLLEYICCS